MVRRLQRIRIWSDRLDESVFGSQKCRPEPDSDLRTTSTTQSVVHAVQGESAQLLTLLEAMATIPRQDLPAQTTRTLPLWLSACCPSNNRTVGVGFLLEQ